MPPLPPRELSDLSGKRYSSGCLKSTKRNWHGKGTKGYVSTISEGTVRPVRHSTHLAVLPNENNTVQIMSPVSSREQSVLSDT